MAQHDITAEIRELEQLGVTWRQIVADLGGDVTLLGTDEYVAYGHRGRAAFEAYYTATLAAAAPKPRYGRFTKTPIGTWGARIPADLHEVGAQVELQRRDGSVTTVTLGTISERVGDDVVAHIVTERHVGAHGEDVGRGGICAECERPRRGLLWAHDSSGIVGQVCPSCFGPSETLSFS